jgi:predicted Zn-ribbon and HTH transcriptional regulator
MKEFLQMKNNKWALIKNDFEQTENIGEYIRKVCIDAWMTDDPDEDGTSIAYVCEGKEGVITVEYVDETAKEDNYAQAVIKYTIEQLEGADETHSPEQWYSEFVCNDCGTKFQLSIMDAKRNCPKCKSTNHTEASTNKQGGTWAIITHEYDRVEGDEPDFVKDNSTLIALVSASAEQEINILYVAEKAKNNELLQSLIDEAVESIKTNDQEALHSMQYAEFDSNEEKDTLIFSVVKKENMSEFGVSTIPTLTLLELIKIEDQKHYCREIYKDKNTKRLYCRHINDRYSKGVYVNHWNTFNGEPDCPLRNGVQITIGNQTFVIERDQFTDWAIEREKHLRPSTGRRTKISISEKTWIDLKEHPSMYRESTVIIHDGWEWNIGTIHNKKELEEVLNFLEIELTTIDNEVKYAQTGKIVFYNVSKNINNPCDGGFWNMEQLQEMSRGQKLKKFKGLSNGSLVDCYIGIGEDRIDIYRPNPNAKEVYQKLSQSEEINYRRNNWYL